MDTAVSKTVTIGAVALVIGMAGCITHAPGGLAYSTRDSENVGATTSGAGGVISGSDSTPTDDKQQRGNTPPGVDRDGHGPAAGAIVDPTGAVTRGKAF
jgi:hypothetical protein